MRRFLNSLFCVLLTLPILAQQQILDKANQIKQLADEIIELAQPAPAPTPVDCVVGPWTLQSATAWTPSTCPVEGVQTRTETWGREVLQAPANGGTACPALTETRTASQTCTYVPLPPPPTDGVISRMDCQGGTSWPRCNMTGVWETANAPITKAYVATPKGYGGTEWTAIPWTGARQQPYAGWGLNVTHPLGTSRFFRFSIRVAAGFNATGVGDVWGDKLIIHANGSGGDRVICQISPKVGMTDLSIACGKGIDIYPNGTRYVPLRIGQWDKVQVEVRNGANGFVKMWINNTNYATPTSASESMSLNLPSSTMIGVGFYWGTVIAPGGSLRLAVGDFAWDDNFDPAF